MTLNAVLYGVLKGCSNYARGTCIKHFENHCRRRYTGLKMVLELIAEEAVYDTAERRGDTKLVEISDYQVLLDGFES